MRKEYYMRNIKKIICVFLLAAITLLGQVRSVDAESYNEKDTNGSGGGGSNEIKQYRLVEECEPNDTMATATEYDEGQEVFGTVSSSDKYDYYVFYLQAGVKYYFLAEYPTGNEDYSIVIVYNINGSTYQATAIYGNSYETFYDKNYCYTTYTPRNSGYYYARIRGYGEVTQYKFSIHSDQNELTLRKRNGQWYAVYFLDNQTYYGTTLIKYNGKYYYVRDGRLNKSATLVKYNGGWWYVKNGTICKDRTLVKYNNSYWYVSNGRINYSATLVKYNGTYWYVRNGKLCRDEAVVYYNGSYWYVNSGKLQNYYNGEVYIDGSWWWVENGKAS